ncbi:hypothetical protein ACHAWF_014995 [Thalassiosira exigua]
MGNLVSLVVGAVSLGLTAIGFGPSGIIGGSIAAGVQSSIGNVAAGTMFSALQSAGASGVISAAGITSAGVFVATLPGGSNQATDNDIVQDREVVNHEGYPTFDSIEKLEKEESSKMKVLSSAGIRQG